MKTGFFILFLRNLVQSLTKNKISDTDITIIVVVIIIIAGIVFIYIKLRKNIKIEMPSIADQSTITKQIENISKSTNVEKLINSKISKKEVPIKKNKNAKLVSDKNEGLKSRKLAITYINRQQDNINMPPYEAINNNIDQIIQSIKPIHVTEYDWLVRNINQVTEAEYQRRYKAFWRLNGAGLSQDFCQVYFHHLQTGTTNNNLPKLSVLANQLYKTPTSQNKQTLQFSFCTKLCHMLNPELPIYDSKIRDFYAPFASFTAPNSNLPVKQRISRFIEFHKYLVTEYNRVLDNGLLTASIQAFRQRFNPQHFTDIKVIDSLIWASSPTKKSADRE